MTKARIVFLAILLCLVTIEVDCMPTRPDWFLKLESKPSEIIGYGIGKGLENAKASARKDIASQVDIRVKSENEFSTLERNGILEEKTHIVINEYVG